MKTYILATETNGIIAHLDIAPMARNQAETHAKTLRKLLPSVPVYVINIAAQ